MKKFLVAAALIAFASTAMAQDAMKLTKVTPDALTWKDNPAFPKDIQIATLVGDPTKAGEVVVLRIKFPANSQIPPHTHPYAEVVTLISGTIGTSEGEKLEKKGEMLKASSIPSFYTTENIPLNDLHPDTVSAKRAMRGDSLCSGMVGINS